MHSFNFKLVFQILKYFSFLTKKYQEEWKDICRKMNKNKLFRGIKQTIPQKNVEFVPWDFIEEPNY
jgi:hypothetical protein